MIVGALFLLGLMLGFVGVGGAGIVIAVLTVGFGVPVHGALGVSLGSMGFTSLSGTISHFREHNVVVKCGLAVGLFGAAGAHFGVKIATLLPEASLGRLTGAVMLLSAALLWLRMSFFTYQGRSASNDKERFCIRSLIPSAACIGLFAGTLSGLCGVGAAPFIQLGLLYFFRLSLPEVAGTTMLITLPIAFMGGLSYLLAGHLDVRLFLQTVAGLMSGSYVGAKFTRRVHPGILKAAMVVMPFIGGLVLVLASK
jgi:uncharacterized membrane protein YfcA